MPFELNKEQHSAEVTETAAQNVTDINWFRKNINIFFTVDPAKTDKGKYADIDYFGYLLGELIQKNQSWGGEDPEKRIKFQHSFGGLLDNPHDEIVTWELVSRSPWTTEQGASPGSGRKTKKAILLGQEPDRKNPGYLIYTFLQGYDNYVKVSCWTQDVNLSLTRSLWVEELIAGWRWWFRVNGLDEILSENWEGLLERETHGNKVLCYPMTYFIRTQRASKLREKTVEKIGINVAIANATEN